MESKYARTTCLYRHFCSNRMNNSYKLIWLRFMLLNLNMLSLSQIVDGIKICTNNLFI